MLQPQRSGRLGKMGYSFGLHLTQFFISARNFADNDDMTEGAESALLGNLDVKKQKLDESSKFTPQRQRQGGRRESTTLTTIDRANAHRRWCVWFSGG